MADKPATVTIDGTKYEIDSLSKETRATLSNIGAVEQELRRLRTQTGIARIAQQALGAQLRAQLSGEKQAE